ncbi:MAG: hypothetical protein Q4E65_01390 [Clostridia bacterium]|nr:hypothetical protein [Clostridia bacterium]
MKKVFSMLFILCMIFLLLFSSAALHAAQDALSLWAGQVVPALLPFFICTDMLQRMGMTPRGAVPFFLMSILAGAPSGARLCADSDAQDGACTARIAACNVIGPMFVSGAFCAGMLQCPRLALPILLSQYAGALMMLWLCRRTSFIAPSAPAQAQPIACALSASIYGGVMSMLSIGGVILFYRVLLSLLGALWAWLMLPPLPPLPGALLTGMLEVVNGCALLPALQLSVRQTGALAAFLFSFGGLCVMTQSMQFYPLDVWRYMRLKLVQGLLAAFLAYLVTPFFFTGAQGVFYTFDMHKIERNALSALAIFLISSFAMLGVWIWCAALQHRQRK